MSVLRTLPDALHNRDIQNSLAIAGFALLALGSSIVTAQLVVDGNWHVAVGLMLALPTLLLLHRYPLACLLIWLLLAPFVVATNGGAARKAYWVIHRLLPPATLGLIVLSALLRTHSRKLPRLGWIEVAMLGYLGVSALSIVYLSDAVLATLYHLYDRVFIPICLYLLVRLVRPDAADLRRLVPVFAFILLAQSIIGALSWFVPQVLPDPWLNRVGLRTTGSLRAYSVFSTTMIFAGIFILHWGLTQKRKLARVGAVLLFLLANVMVFFSYSRGSWLAGLLVICGLFCLYPTELRRIGLNLAPIVLVVALLVAVLSTGDILADVRERASTRFYSSQSTESALSRLPVYYASYRMFTAKPAFGWGFGNFDRYDRQFQGQVLDLFSPDKDHASHNVYLTLIAEQGIIGFFLFLSPVFFWLRETWRTWPHMPAHGFWSRKLVAVLWLVILSHLVVNNFSNMRVVFGLGLWWIALGLIANTLTGLRRDERFERI